MWDLSYYLKMSENKETISDDNRLEKFIHFLSINRSRYETEAEILLQHGVFEKNILNVFIIHFLRDGGSGYKISNQFPHLFEEVFFQSFNQDTQYQKDLLVDQIAQSEVDASYLQTN